MIIISLHIYYHQSPLIAINRHQSPLIAINRHQSPSIAIMTNTCKKCSQICYDGFIDSLDTEYKSLRAKIDKGLRSAESSWVPLIKRSLNHLNWDHITFNGRCGKCKTVHTECLMIRSAGMVFIMDLLLKYISETTDNILFTDDKFPKVCRQKLMEFNTTSIPISSLWKGSQYYHREFFGCEM